MSRTKPQIPILAMRCKGCGAVYAAHTLAYPIDGEIGEQIAEWVRDGDEPFITYEVKLSACKCLTPMEQILKRDGSN